MTSLCLLVMMIVMGLSEADAATTTTTTPTPISGGNEVSHDDITVTSVPHDVQCRTSAMSSLLEVLGYTPSCIASSLALCSQLKDDHTLGSHIQDMQRVLEELRPSTSQCGGGADIEEVKTWGPRNCKDLLDTGDTGRGLRQIQPYPGRPYDTATVYCDQVTDGGGWTVFQHRTNASAREDFERSWAEYQQGFGNIEFWLGLDLMHILTLSDQELRVDLADYDGGQRWARYRAFKVGPSSDHYRLTVTGYTGDAGDSMTYHNGQQFSTHNADHDASSGDNCASTRKGGWWYNDCHHCNPNGYPFVGTYVGTIAQGITWHHWRGHWYSLMNTTFMIRPIY